MNPLLARSLVARSWHKSRKELCPIHSVHVAVSLCRRRQKQCDSAATTYNASFGSKSETGSRLRLRLRLRALLGSSSSATRASLFGLVIGSHTLSCHLRRNGRSFSSSSSLSSFFPTGTHLQNGRARSAAQISARRFGRATFETCWRLPEPLRAT